MERNKKGFPSLVYEMDNGILILNIDTTCVFVVVIVNSCKGITNNRYSNNIDSKQNY